MTYTDILEATEAIILQTAEQAVWLRKHRFSKDILRHVHQIQDENEKVEFINNKIAALQIVIAEQDAKRAKAKSWFERVWLSHQHSQKEYRVRCQYYQHLRVLTQMRLAYQQGDWQTVVHLKPEHSVRLYQRPPINKGWLNRTIAKLIPSRPNWFDRMKMRFQRALGKPVPSVKALKLEGLLRRMSAEVYLLAGEPNCNERNIKLAYQQKAYQAYQEYFNSSNNEQQQIELKSVYIKWEKEHQQGWKNLLGLLKQKRNLCHYDGLLQMGCERMAESGNSDVLKNSYMLAQFQMNILLLQQWLNKSFDWTLSLEASTAARNAQIALLANYEEKYSVLHRKKLPASMRTQLLTGIVRSQEFRVEKQEPRPQYLSPDYIKLPPPGQLPFPIGITGIQDVRLDKVHRIHELTRIVSHYYSELLLAVQTKGHDEQQIECLRSQLSTVLKLLEKKIDPKDLSVELTELTEQSSTLIISVFLKGLKDSKVTSLDLSCNQLGSCRIASVTAFVDGIKGSNFTSLNLSNNYIPFDRNEHLITLINCLIYSKVTSLNLSKNSLFLLDNDWFKAFGRALKYSRVTSLNLSDNHLHEWEVKDERWLILADAVLQNPCITEIEGLDPLKLPAALNDALAGNKTLRALQDFKRTNDETAEVFHARCEHQVKDVLLVLSKWGNKKNQNPSDETCRLLESAIVRFLTLLFYEKSVIRADDLLLKLRSTSEPVRNLYFEYCQNIYLLPEDTNQSAGMNFAAAVPFLIDSAKAPVIFTSQQQGLLDIFLQSACSINVNPEQQQQSLDITTRLTLLRHLQLKFILEELPLASESNPSATIASQTIAGLQDEISVLLRKWPSTLNQVLNQEKEYEQCLERVCNKLERITHTAILQQEPILQLNSLILFNEDTLKKTTAFKLWFQTTNAKSRTLEKFIQQSNNYTDQLGRLLIHPADHLARLDTVLTQLTNVHRPLNSAQRITQLQQLVCRYFNETPSTSNNNPSFFQPELAGNESAQTANQIAWTFNQFTRSLDKQPGSLQLLIRAINHLMEKPQQAQTFNYHTRSLYEQPARLKLLIRARNQLMQKPQQHSTTSHNIGANEISPDRESYIYR